VHGCGFVWRTQESTGYMHPAPRKKDLDNLKVVYGIIPGRYTREYKLTEECITQLVRNCSIFGNLLSYVARIEPT